MRHHHDDHAHGDAQRNDGQRFAQWNETGRQHGAGGHADGDHAHQAGCLVERHVQRLFGPFQHDQLQGGACAPEQGRYGQGDLAQLVFPQDGIAIGKIGNQFDRIAFLVRIHAARVGNLQVGQGCQRINAHYHAQGCFRLAGDARIDQGNVDGQQHVGYVAADERAAHDGAEDDGGDGQAFDPAIGRHEFFRRQQFRQDAVLGGRVHGRAKADDGVGQQRMHVEEDEGAAEDLDHVGDEHDLAFRQCIGEGADKSG
ncbi:hypothetical protein D3C72_1274770 [compost metagenome]